MEYIKRDIEATILEAARCFSVITVTGPRQSGKTTMLRHAFPELHYYFLEDRNGEIQLWNYKDFFS